jgi:hypothetical protein
MRVAKILPPLTLYLASSLATAQEKNCSDLTNPQARQECMVKGQHTNLNDRFGEILFLSGELPVLAGSGGPSRIARDQSE